MAVAKYQRNDSSKLCVSVSNLREGEQVSGLTHFPNGQS